LCSTSGISLFWFKPQPGTSGWQPQCAKVADETVVDGAAQRRSGYKRTDAEARLDGEHTLCDFARFVTLASL
jgi:hypothetical protein